MKDSSFSRTTLFASLFFSLIITPLAFSQSGSLSVKVSSGTPTSPSTNGSSGPAPWLVGEPITIPLSASYENAPTQNPSYGSMCTINGPLWDPWMLTVQWSPDNPDNLQGTSQYGHMLTQGSDGSTATLDFIPFVEGYWSLMPSATVRFNDGSCGNTWAASGLTTILLVLAAPAVDNTIDIACKTNNPLVVTLNGIALTDKTKKKGENLGDVFVPQPGTHEILVGWTSRFTAPAGITDVKWHYKLPGSDVEKLLGNGSPFEYKAIATSTYTVYCRGKKDGQDWGPSEQRTVIASDIAVPNGNDGFNLVIGTGSGLMTDGPYSTDKTDPFKIHLPSTVAMTMKASVQYAQNAPQVASIQWGFVQSVAATGPIVLDFDANGGPLMNGFAWLPASQVGQTVDYNDQLTMDPLPADKLLCDSPEGNQLYGGTKGNVIGTTGQATDTPGPKTVLGVRDFPPKPATPLLNVYYRIQKHYKKTYNFNTWLVVFNSKTQQYVPLRQRGWSIVLDTNKFVAGQEVTWTATLDQADKAQMTAMPAMADSVDYYTTISLTGATKQKTK